MNLLSSLVRKIHVRMLPQLNRIRHVAETTISRAARDFAAKVDIVEAQVLVF